jgi:hypothetical protein
MVSDERERLTRRAEDLRRLHEGIDDGMARTAITAEIAKHEALIAKHEALIAKIDTTATTEISPADPENMGPKTQPDI